MNFIQQMKLINGCQPALDWADGKTFDEAYETSQWGEWMGFTFDGLHPNDLRKYKVAAICLLELSDMMTNDQIKLCNDAIKYSEGLVDERTLKLNTKKTSETLIKEREQRDNLTDEQCLNNALHYVNKGSINGTCFWAARIGNEVKMQKKFADIIRQNLPKNTWDIQQDFMI